MNRFKFQKWIVWDWNFLNISGLIDDLSCLLITRAYNYQIIWRGARAELSFEDWSLKLLKKSSGARSSDSLDSSLSSLIFIFFFLLTFEKSKITTNRILSKLQSLLSFWANRAEIQLFENSLKIKNQRISTRKNEAESKMKNEEQKKK